MQNKSAILVFAVLLTLACLYQLSFTWVTKSVEGKADVIAQNRVDSVKLLGDTLTAGEEQELNKKFREQYLLAVSHQPAYPVIGTTYKKCKKHEINLGLDLQGGMNVILEVSVVDLIRVLSGNSTDKQFEQAIRRARQMQRDSQEDFVTLFGMAWEEVAPGQMLATIFHTRDNKDMFPMKATNEEIIEKIKQQADDAVDRTEQVIRKRIDNLGVVQPKVQKLGGSGRILVELPGVKNKERVRKILQGTAKLEFWETYENQELYANLEEANKMLGKKLAGVVDTAGVDTAETAIDTSGTDTSGTEETIVEESDEQEVSTDTSLASNDTSSADTSGDKEFSLDQLFQDDGTDTTDTASKAAVEGEEEGEKTFEEFAEENPLFGVMRPVLVQDEQGRYYPGEGPSIGYAHIKDTAKVNEYFQRKDVKALFPPRIKFLWAAKAYDDNEEYLQLYAIKVVKRDGTALLEGDGVIDARVDADPLGNPEIAMVMNPDGAQTWKRMTRDNVGKSIAIVLDDYVYSAPTVQGEISGGRSSITGRFTQEEAADLANVLKAGKLPAPAKIIEEAVVGPSLGKEAIESGFTAFLLALAIVLAYMIFYYSRAGLVANVALITNLFFVIGVLASLGATLTLPGIAGIVLTIGMSVDANVLIFERIREELTAGKGMRLAIVDGYKAAYSSIIDANVTTLLTGIILYIFGTGPIKGFATTLIIGILTSLFCAILITRLIFEWQLNKNKVLTFANRITEGAFKNINIGFVGKRKLYYMISGLVIAAGIFSLATRGLNQGVDFTGGRSYIVRFEQPVQVKAVRISLGNVFLTGSIKHPPEVKTFGASNQVKITTKYLIDDDGEKVDSLVEAKLFAGLKAFAKPGSTQETFAKNNLMSSQKVGPTIADDIKVAAIWSTIFALIAIFLYILIRFRKWQYSLGALVAMLHDVVVVLSVFSIFYGVLPFSLEIDQAFIAAILTVVGYSINDTVVVFDRIREYLGLYKRKEMKEVVNDALNSTLSRTFNTSISTFFVLLMIFIFGGEVIRGFVFALMIGVVVGTYSSLCVATPILIDLQKEKPSEGKK